MSTKHPFTPDPKLTAIAVGYGEEVFIADDVLPRTPVGKMNFKYTAYNKADIRTIPDTKVSRRGRPNQVEFGSTELNASCEDYGLDDSIPQADIDEAPDGHDPKGQAAENLMALVLLDRERRVANTVQDTNNFAAANQQALVGGDKFSDFANSDPLGVMMEALDVPLIRPNVGVIGQTVWTKLRRHPQLVKAANRNDGDSGLIMRSDLAELLELEEILIGTARYNSAKKGQDAVYQRLWGSHISLIHRNRNANTRNATAFGYTAQFGPRVAGSWPDKNIGLRGGEWVRAGESVAEVVCDPNAGYLIQNAI